MLEMWLITAVCRKVFSSTKIDPLPALPVVPTVDLLLQPTCGVQTGTIKLRLKITFSTV
jgi:hypothetical protein